MYAHYYITLNAQASHTALFTFMYINCHCISQSDLTTPLVCVCVLTFNWVASGLVIPLLLLSSIIITSQTTHTHMCVFKPFREYCRTVDNYDDNDDAIN